MTLEEIRYFEIRARDEIRRAAKANNSIVRQAHLQFANAYADRVAQAKAVSATIDSLMGDSARNGTRYSS